MYIYIIPFAPHYIRSPYVYKNKYTIYFISQLFHTYLYIYTHILGTYAKYIRHTFHIFMYIFQVHFIYCKFHNSFWTHSFQLDVHPTSGDEVGKQLTLRSWTATPIPGVPCPPNRSLAGIHWKSTQQLKTKQPKTVLEGMILSSWTFAKCWVQPDFLAAFGVQPRNGPRQYAWEALDEDGDVRGQDWETRPW